MSAVAEKEKTVLRGGEFLVKDSDPMDIFTPEEWNEEQRNIKEMIEDFLQQEVLPQVEAMDKWEDPDILPNLLKKAGELGMLGATVPEQYGGMGLDFNTGMLITEEIGKGHSFSVGMAAHTGIGLLPILYFGNEAQKEKYVPKLATGEWLASYCLTEPGSGSDALGAKTKAELTEDGKHYIVNGQKMWITNAGFADLFIVFAKIDGEKFTGFIVERDTEGVSFGEEEDKMGIKGSSTRQVFFSDAKVPAENVLGTIGEGHKIAFNILNIGRLKLGAAVLGASKAVVNLSVKYANERHQFQQPISSFGAIQQKLAEQCIRTWVTEAAVYRASDYIQHHEHKLMAEGMAYEEAIQAAAREYAVECAIMKVVGSETLDFVADEGVQIYGGYGFSEEYPMARAYRDARINRIFEGTNEINRMLTLNDLLKKALKGEIDLMTPAQNIQKELTQMPSMDNGNGSPFKREENAVKNFKKAALMCAGLAAQKYMQELADEQEVLLHLADMIMQAYNAESALLRAKKIHQTQGEEAANLPHQMVAVYVSDAAERISQSGKNVLSYISEGDEQRVTLMGLKRFTKVEPYDTITARRAIAAKIIDADAYTY